MVSVSTSDITSVIEASVYRDGAYAELADSADQDPTAYQAGNVIRTLVETAAEAVADLTRAQLALAQGGVLEDAAGAWLSLLAEEEYAVVRDEAVAAEGLVLVTDSGSTGPHTVEAGSILMQNDAGVQFRNTTGGSLPKGGVLQVAVKALAPGTAGNIGNGTLTSVVSSPYAGITVSNPPPDPGGGSWITVTGVEEQSDASLRAECAAQWVAGEASRYGTSDAWVYSAKRASAMVTRARAIADHGGTAGKVAVVVAGSSGAVASSVVTEVWEYLLGYLSTTMALEVMSASSLTVPVSGTVEVRESYAADAQADAEEALDALAADTPIGGDPLIGGAVARSAIIHAIESAREDVGAVISVSLTAPVEDVLLAETEVPVFDYSGLIWVGV